MSSVEGHYWQPGDHAEHSLEHDRAISDRAGQSTTSTIWPGCRAQLGDYWQALTYGGQASP